MRIDVPKESVGRLVGVLAAVSKAFPQRKDELRDVVGQSRNGITLSVEPYTFKQTDPQRGYYHMWKNAFAQFCGCTPDEMHEHLLCEAYGSEVVRTRIGLRIRPLKRSNTKEANREDYSVLIDTLIRTAAEMDFTVPPPLRETEDGNVH